MLSNSAMTQKELYVLLTLITGTVLWMFMRTVEQPAVYHTFADNRLFFGIPNAADVLSNFAFVAVGLVGLFRIHQRQKPLEPVFRLSLSVFFLGFFLTGFGSAYYHWNPTN